jgi:hypothetical protein
MTAAHRRRDAADLPDWLRRAIRTWLQSFLASLLATLSTVGAADLPALTTWLWWQKALAAAVFSAGMATLTAVVSALQNSAEDSGAIPALLKAPASGGENPVPDPGTFSREEVH